MKIQNTNNTEKKTFTNLIWYKLRGYFFNGLLILLPISLTIAIIKLGFTIFKSWLKPIYDLEPEYLQQIPYSEFFVTLFFIFLVGALFKIFVLEPLVQAIEAVLMKIPLLNPIYSGIKQLVHAFTAQDTLSFQTVILVEFPRKGMYSVGFITSEVPRQISPNEDKKFFTVFIPTTPNPTTGYFIFAPEDEITVTDLTRQEAMSLIISGGIVKPTRFSEKV